MRRDLKGARLCAAVGRRERSSLQEGKRLRRGDGAVAHSRRATVALPRSGRFERSLQQRGFLAAFTAQAAMVLDECEQPRIVDAPVEPGREQLRELVAVELLV